MHKHLFVLFAVVAAAVPFVASCEEGNCGTKKNCSGPDDEDSGALDASTDAPSDSPIVVDEDGRACDTSKSPSAEPCVNDERFAVYVSPSGVDTNPGTKASPKKTFGAALTAAKGAGKAHVIACEGVYDEHVKLDAAVDGLRVHGGFGCGDWSYDSAKKVRVKPATVGYALEIKAVTSAVVEDVAFEAVDGTSPGASSVAAFVASSQGVVLRRVALTAGKGLGAANAVRVASNHSAAGTMAGAVPSGATGGGGGKATCADGTTSEGGKGGNGATGQLAGGDGVWNPVGTVEPGVRDGKGGSGGVTVCLAPAFPGARGAAATGVQSAARWGTLADTGWTPASGEAGRPGRPGQGGGGGGGKYDVGPPVAAVGGGGGGAGGCGGAGAPGGGGGGSSFALLVVRSAVSLEGSALAASDAGKGGDGAQGESGQAGGDPALTTACTGAAGGYGAGGGGSGGGAGGLSAGVGYVGQAPNKDATTTFTTKALGQGGAPGDGATGIVPGAPATGTGKVGLAGEVVSLE